MEIYTNWSAPNYQNVNVTDLLFYTAHVDSWERFIG